MLDSHKAIADSPEKARKVSRKQDVAIEGVVKEQRARLDAAGTKMAELGNRYFETVASTATFRKELS